MDNTEMLTRAAHESRDHTAARALADHLQEAGDWKHHIYSRTASGLTPGGLTPTPKGFAGWVQHRGSPAAHACHAVQFGPTHVRINTYPATNSSARGPVMSHHTHAEYEAMRTDASAAGITFPPIPEAPTQLARPEGESLFGRLRKQFLGKPAGAQGLAATDVELQHVASALQEYGHPDALGHAPRYAAHVKQFVKDNPSNPLVQEYKDKLGLAGGHIGPSLTHTTRKLVGVVNLLLHAVTEGREPRLNLPKPGPAHVPPQPRPKPARELPSGFVELPHPDEAPLDLAPTAPVEPRHETLHRMLRAKKFTKEDIIQEFMKVHELDRKNAQASIRRAAARLKLPKGGTGPTKLARADVLPWLDQLRQRGIPDHTAAQSLSDKLQEGDDWRHHLFANTATISAGEGRSVFTARDGRVHGVRMQHGQVVNHGDGAHSNVHFDAGHAVVTTHWDLNNQPVHTVLPRDKYEQMRHEAGNEGVHFPPHPAPAKAPPVKLARTDVLPWLTKRGGTELEDHNAAVALSDKLHDNSDWRHHLFANPASFDPKSGAGAGLGRFTLSSGEGKWVPTSLSDPDVDHGDGGSSTVRFAKGHIVVSSAFHDKRVRGDYPIHTVMTPERYEQMKADAAAHGVAFPANPHAAPTKLAKPKAGETLAAKHLTGTAYVGEHTGEAYKIDPLIEGTALAYHLRDFAQNHADSKVRALATHALAGTTGKITEGTDAFTALGAALKGDPRAEMYNWAHVDKNLALDRWTDQVIRKHIPKPAGMSEHQYWDKVHRQYGSKDNEAFWARIGKESGNPYQFYKQDAATIRDRVRASINRHADRHLDREYLKAVKTDGQQNDDVFGLDPVFRAAPRGAMKFSREAFEAHIRANPTDATGHLVYADWLDENDHPDEARAHRIAGARKQWYDQAVNHTGASAPTTMEGHQDNLRSAAGRLPHWAHGMFNHDEIHRSVAGASDAHRPLFQASADALRNRVLGLTPPEDHAGHMTNARLLRAHVLHAGIPGTTGHDEHLASALEYAHQDAGPPEGRGRPLTPGFVAPVPRGPGPNLHHRREKVARMLAYAQSNPPPE